MHLRGHGNILKRLLLQVCGLNLGLLMRQLLGVGTPRGLHTAGARAAEVNRFIDTVLEDSATPSCAERESFIRGLAWIDRRSRASSGADFIETPPAEQEALLTVRALPISSRENAAPDDRDGVEFFEAIKRLTVTGYYTSEAGLREELDDDGTQYFSEKPGCAHPEHRA